MRFNGYLDNGRPFISLYVSFPSIHVEGYVEFLVDTGSDTTILNDVDAKHVGIDLANTSDLGRASGVGSAPKRGIPARGLVVFTDNNNATKQFLLPFSEIIVGCPYSLLGRDIIQQFQLTFDATSVRFDKA